MIIGYARVSTTEQNLGLRHDDLKPAFDASVDPTEARNSDVGLRDEPLQTLRYTGCSLAKLITHPDSPRNKKRHLRFSDAKLDFYDCSSSTGA
jgi:hypothetical protein